MADEPEDIRTLKEKALFYTTAFFVLLGTFSLFAFLFLVPFVIDPAFTTIFMQFDTRAAFCITVETEYHKGASNCSWTSCREGCTKDVYECTQIRVNYKIWKPPSSNVTGSNETFPAAVVTKNNRAAEPVPVPVRHQPQSFSVAPKDLGVRFERAIREYDYVEDSAALEKQIAAGAGAAAAAAADKSSGPPGYEFMEYPDQTELTGLMGNDSEWFFTGARLFPNVKGCGYPPMLNCSIWGKRYKEIGSNFSCYYSKVDPGLVISDLDMWQNTLNLVYAMAIPIPSFIISVIYLTFAYFKIYNEDEESAPLDKNAEDMAGEDRQNDDEITDGGDVGGIVPNGVTTTSMVSAAGGSEPLTPSSSSDLASFGHQLKVKMADEMSRESLDAGLMSNSASFQG